MVPGNEELHELQALFPRAAMEKVLWLALSEFSSSELSRERRFL
jgi:hypothetical protein